MNSRHAVLFLHKSADIAVSIGNLSKIYPEQSIGYLPDVNEFNSKKIDTVSAPHERDVTILHDPVLFKQYIRKHRKRRYILLVKQFHIKKILAFVESFAEKYDIGKAFVSYNSDKIILKPSVFWLNNQLSKTALLEKILSTSTSGETVVYSVDKLNIKATLVSSIRRVDNVTRIIWHTIPSYVYYCEFYACMFNRENYPDRAKNTVNVESIFLVHDCEVGLYNKLYSAIIADETTFASALKSVNYRIVVENNKVVVKST